MRAWLAFGIALVVLFAGPAAGIHIPDSLVITVMKISTHGPGSALKSVDMGMPDGSTLTLSVQGTYGDSAPGYHYNVDAQLVGSLVLGNRDGAGRITVVSSSPLVLTGAFTLEGHTIVLGSSQSSPTGIVLSYNAHKQMAPHSRSRFGPGAERDALAKTFTDVEEREVLRRALYPRSAFRSEFCSVKGVAHEISVSVVLDRGMVAALEHDLGVTVGDKNSATGLTEEGEAWVHSLVSQASLPFEESFMTRVRLASVTTLAAADAKSMSGYHSKVWNEVPARHGNRGCAFDIDTRLTKFSAWKSAWSDQEEEVSAVILLTDCHPPPGTIGLANTGYVCDTRSAFCKKLTSYGYKECHRARCPERSAACFTNTAVVSYVSGQAPIVFGHELAHLAGCVHSSTHGDIMSVYLSDHVNAHFNNDDAERACALLEENSGRVQTCVREA